jgi:hypothetical protein
VVASGATGTGMTVTTNADLLPQTGQDSSVFMVVLPPSTGGGMVFNYGATSGAPGSLRAYYTENNKFDINATEQSMLESADMGSAGHGHVVSCVQPASGVHNAWFDGTVFTSNANFSSTWTTSAGGSARLFQYLPTETFPFAGAIAEIIVANGLLNTADRQAIEGHLAWKWNTQAYLPSDHPWKTVMPSVSVA